MKPPRALRFLCLGLALLATLLLTQCGRPAGGPGQGMEMPPAPVTLGEVEQRSIIEWGEFTGRVEATETVDLRPRVSGYLTEVHFQAGEMVEQDQLLFTIDQRSFQTQLDQAAAELQRAEAQLSSSKKEFDRVEALLAARALSPEQADARESAFLQAKALLAGAQAAHQSAQIELSHTEVRAPIAGRISRALVTQGNYVSGNAGGATLLTSIVTVDPVYVYVDVDESSLLELQALRMKDELLRNEAGQVPVKMQLSDDDSFAYEGFIESFDNRLDADTGSLLVRTQFANPDQVLTPGLFARVKIPMTSEYPALLIEDQAVLTDQANKYVLGVDENNLSVYRPVVLGPIHDGKRIVRSGLEKGEQIIVNGQARLPMPGLPVAPVDPNAPPPGPPGAPAEAEDPTTAMTEE